MQRFTYFLKLTITETYSVFEKMQSITYY